MSADSVDSAITLLLEFPFAEHALPHLMPTLHAMIRELPLDDVAPSAWLATSHAVVTCYLDGHIPPVLSKQLQKIATAQLRTVLAGPIEISRLRCVAMHAGASRDADAAFHYVVRTDVEQGGDEELQRWYDEEHMAMLAAVPGTIRARRLISLDAAPRYYACYDLVAPAVLMSAEWLQARQTAWSERVRPTFRNTRRVISRKLDLAGPELTLPGAAENPARSD